MAAQLKIVLALIISSILAGCEIADVGGMFIAGGTVNDRFSQSVAWNAQHSTREIQVTGDSYEIYSMSDSHVGTTNNLNAFFDDAKASSAAAVVMVGDLTTGNEKDYDVLVDNIPARDIIPSFPIAGNHDLYFKGWEHFYNRFGSSTYTFVVKTDVAKDLFICLDTGEGTLGSDQLAWLKEMLSNNRTQYRHCVIYTHNNLFRIRRTASTTPLVEELNVLIALFAKHQVDMVITGHDHVRYAERMGSTTHIAMDALKDGLNNSGYFKLICYSDRLDYAFINFQ